MELVNKFADSIVNWFVPHAFMVGGIIVGALIVNRLAHVFLTKLIRRSVVGSKYLSAEAEEKRENTLIEITLGTARILVWLTALLMIASDLGLNIGPILAAAGVAGLAFGFGGQYLIRDVISGLFIIMENQYRVGDVVCFGSTCGLVENITLRLTTLRDLDGTVHHVPHGEVKQVANLSKDFARLNLNIGVSYNSDLEKVIGVIDKVGQELFQDKLWQEHIIKAPQALGVEDFADSAVVIKVLGDTQPLKQWDVTREFRKRLKIAFDKAGIEIPFPQRVIHQA